MNDYELGQQKVINEIKTKVAEIEKNSKGMDIVFDLLELLKSLKVEPRN